MRGTKRLERMARLAVKYRQPAWVTKSDVGWVQRYYRLGTLVTPNLPGPPIKRLEEVTAEQWFHRYTPQAGNTVVELGAEFGTETLFLSRAVGPTGRVIAVEAHPGTAAGLSEMVRLNGLANVSVVQVAVGDETGTTTISDGPAISNTVGTGDVTVPACTFGDLLEREKVDQVDFLKVNIEGAEGPLFRAMTKADAVRVRHIVVSCHDFRADAGEGEWYRTGDSVDNDLERLGFDWFSRETDPRHWVRMYRYAARAG